MRWPYKTLLYISNLALIFGAMHAFGFVVNTSKSLEIGLYRDSGEKWARGDLVLACLPDAAATFGVSRGYINPHGRCENHSPIIKRVFAIPGDRVILDSFVNVNGQRLPNSKRLTVDGQGRTLPTPEDGVTPADSVWLFSDYNDQSFDARYFGAIDQSLIQKKIVPVWTW